MALNLRRRLRGVLGAGTASALFVAVVVAANVLAYRGGGSVDLTENNRLTLSPETKRVVHAVHDTMTIEAFLRPGTGQGADVQALLDRYHDANRRVRVEVTDPDADPGRAQRLGITHYGTAVLRYRERRVDLTTISEPEVTSAMLRLVRGRTPAVCFVSGHGEASLTDESASGASELAALTRRNGFAPKTITLVSGRVDPGCDVVVIAGPREPFASAEDTAIQTYLRGDGKVMLLADGVTRANPNTITRPWGIDFLGGVALDRRSNFDNDPSAPVVTDFPTTHQIVDGVPSLLLPAPAGLSIPDTDPRDGLHVTTLARTSGSSFLTDDPDAPDPQASLPGPVVVAAAADASRVAGTTIHRSRLLVIADTVFANNQLLLTLGNARMFANGLSWLAQEEVLLTVGTKPQGSHPLTMTPEHRDLAFATTAVTMPLAVALTGVVVFVVRRRR
jgi:ABC-type uncharacterized transport system involved in gliding motility auxiliary subunit